MNLSKNFNSEEFVVSRDHPEMAKRTIVTNLDLVKFKVMADYILQPTRNYLGQPISIISGKRSEELNAAVHNGEATNSLHLYKGIFDAAVDFWCLDHLWDAFDFIRDTFVYGELIIYVSSIKAPRFIHVALPNSKDYMQTLVQQQGKFHQWDDWAQKNLGI